MSQTITTIEVEDIGTVLIKKSKRAKYLRVRVDPKNGVTVVQPLLVSDTRRNAFLQDKKDWILKAIQRQQEVHNKYTLFTNEEPYTTRGHSLNLCKHAKNTLRSHVANQKINVWYPEQADIADPRIQEFIRRAIREAWRIEAKFFLPKRVGELAEEHGFDYNKLTVKNAKTRWGSCSGKNNINLNLQLMRLPDRLIDYVILHELNHTVHKHHQKLFWESLEQILPGARKLDKELNNYHLEYW